MDRKQIYNQADMAKALGITEAMWSLVLSGKRSFRFAKALKCARIIGTGVVLWIDPSQKALRRAEFEHFIKTNKGDRDSP